MMPDDPFAPLNVDRTVMMPVPGGRVPARPSPADPAEPVEAAPVSGGLNPLIAAANPLLNMIPQLRSSVSHPNAAALRDSLTQEIQRFEATARAAGMPNEKVLAARYALCTLVDETAASTPWGASGAWAQHGLLARFHGEVEGGEKFFQLLARLAENPQAHADVLELMYVCLQLGFEGRYRVASEGPRQLEAIRARLLAIIRRQRGEYERELSPNWRGLPPVPQARLGWLPLWVVGAVAALLIFVIYVAFAFTLGVASDRLATDIASVRVATVAPKPAPEPRLAAFLAEEIRRGLVAVDDRRDRSIVTMLGDGLFKPGDAAVSAAEHPLVARIGEAIASVRGHVEVVGHTDNAPIRTLRFPSNWELSRARAQSVATLLAAHVPTERLRAEGRGDTEPLVANDTPQGRARNRRVEIVVHVSPVDPSPAPAAPARK